MSRMPTLKSVMTPFPYSIDVGEDIVTARVMMSEHEVRHLPVTRGPEIVGVITDRDIQVAGAVASGEAPQNLVREVCHSPAFVVDGATALDEALESMAERQVSSVVVTDGEKLVGIVTLTDVTRLLVEALRARHRSYSLSAMVARSYPTARAP